jgi:hypothetical protein
MIEAFSSHWSNNSNEQSRSRYEVVFESAAFSCRIVEKTRGGEREKERVQSQEHKVKIYHCVIGMIATSQPPCLRGAQQSALSVGPWWFHSSGMKRRYFWMYLLPANVSTANRPLRPIQRHVYYIQPRFRPSPEKSSDNPSTAGGIPDSLLVTLLSGCTSWMSCHEPDFFRDASGGTNSPKTLLDTP